MESADPGWVPVADHLVCEVQICVLHLLHEPLGLYK
jgi:hypothetical protein